MIAYKFLRSGRHGPFSGFGWPEPGEWVRPSGEPDLCRNAIHACWVRDLPWWMSDELWEIELAGDVHVGEHKVIARAGRLRARIDGWTGTCGEEYAHACAWRARDCAVETLRRAGHRQAASELAACTALYELLLAARRFATEMPDSRIGLTMAASGAVRALAGLAPTSAYIAAHAALRLDGPAAYAAERAWQAQWLVDRLGLPAPTSELSASPTRGGGVTDRGAR